MGYEYYHKKREMGLTKGDDMSAETEPTRWGDVPEEEPIGLFPHLPGTSARKAGDDMVVHGDGVKELESNHEVKPIPGAPGNASKIRMVEP